MATLGCAVQAARHSAPTGTWREKQGGGNHPEEKNMLFSTFSGLFKSRAQGDTGRHIATDWSITWAGCRGFGGWALELLAAEKTREISKPLPAIFSLQKNILDRLELS